MSRSIIHTEQAPAAIGPYSQAVRVGDTVYLSGQIPLLPSTGAMLEGGIDAQARQVFENMQAVCAAAGGSLADIARLGIFLTDLGDFAVVKALIAESCSPPYPPPSTGQLSPQPRGAQVEVDAILVLG